MAVQDTIARIQAGIKAIKAKDLQDHIDELTVAIAKSTDYSEKRMLNTSKQMAVGALYQLINQP